MRFDTHAFNPEATAFVFPGQGSHCLKMLDPFRATASFVRHYARICELLQRDPLETARTAPESLNRNPDSSLLTVLASVLCLERIQDETPHFQPAAVAGYSVGQWMALHAAGMIDVEQLFVLVHRRAQLMDACMAGAAKTEMLAVVGIAEADLRYSCAEIAQQGYLLEVTNENAPGQFTLGGTVEAIRRAEECLAGMRAKRLQRVPVAGAWHSSLLRPVVPQLVEALKLVVFRPAQLRIIDNVTGEWLPSENGALQRTLAEQVASPVRWSSGIRTLIASGIRHSVEVGYGDLLTKFGFFIDRKIQHVVAFPVHRSEG